MSTIHGKVSEIARDIAEMKIRGAGNIARHAAQALVTAARNSNAKKSSDLLADLESAAKLLLKTRPTAVSLPNSIRYVMSRTHMGHEQHLKLEDLRKLVIDTGNAFIENSAKAVERIGEIGARRIEDGDSIMTHCNSAAVTAILTTAFKQGKSFNVFVCETRPRYQGRITAQELSQAGIPTSLIVDSAAHSFMTKMDKAIVGADTIAANGAVVNKIGTSMVALAAHESRVLFFVAAETYKFSPETMLGQLVQIEERGTSEVISNKDRATMPHIIVRNPAFDITPPHHIDLIITEKGIISPQAAITIIQQEFGSARTDELMKYQTNRSTDGKEF